MYPAGRGTLSLPYRAYASPPEVSLSRTACHPLRATGLTHASRVIAPVRWREAASATVTQLFVPLNDSAPPYLPAVARVAAVMVPVFPLPEESVVVEPLGSSNP